MIEKVSRNSGVVNLSETAVSLGSSLICRIAFGRRFGNREMRRRRFDEILREAQGVLAALSVSDFFPALGWAEGVFGYGDWFERTFRDWDSFYQEVIDEHLDATRKEEKDVVDVLIQLKEERALSVDFTWQHIKALLMVLLSDLLSISYLISLFFLSFYAGASMGWGGYKRGSFYKI